ncbi:MAG: hypothetical protein Kow0069_08860 [Promethearchaeota archaeon]
MEAVLFGSVVEGGARATSDVDVAVVTRRRERRSNMDLLESYWGRAPPEYDIHVFELFPLHVQASVISNWLPIFGNELDLPEVVGRLPAQGFRGPLHRLPGKAGNQKEPDR